MLAAVIAYQLPARALSTVTRSPAALDPAKGGSELSLSVADVKDPPVQLVNLLFCPCLLPTSQVLWQCQLQRLRQRGSGVMQTGTGGDGCHAKGCRGEPGPAAQG